VPFVKVGFAVSGEQQISRAFQVYGEEAQDLSEPLDRMADVIIDAVRAQFDTQGTGGLGHPWTPLSPEYAAWKLARYGPKPILVATGDMKQAMLDKASAVTVTPKRMVYSPVDEKAGYHQDGTVNMPQRKIVALTDAQKRNAVDRVFSEWLNAIRRQAPLGGGR
jgi:phage gpG-like protein